MYTLSTCPWCHKTKQFFRERNIQFEYIDIDLLDEEEREEKRKEIYEQIGYVSFPYVKINGRIFVGYKPTEYEKSLAQ